MIRQTLAGVLALVIAVPALAGGDRFTFRGVTSGMGIEEFRRMPFPDAGKPTRYGRLLDGYGTKCRAVPDRGFTQCTFTASVRGYSSPVNVGYGSRPPEYAPDIPILYLFHQGRLMQVEVRFDPDEVDRLREELTAAYGKPAGDTGGAVQNALGATFADRVVWWDNGVDRVVLRKYDRRLDRGTLIVSHSATSERYEAARDRATRDAGGNYR